MPQLSVLYSFEHHAHGRWGEIVDINLPRDKTTGKTKGFGFIMYEDQRSTVLAVDNMNGSQVLGRTIRVRPKPPYPSSHLISGGPLSKVQPAWSEDQGR